MRFNRETRLGFSSNSFIPVRQPFPPMRERDRPNAVSCVHACMSASHASMQTRACTRMHSREYPPSHSLYKHALLNGDRKVEIALQQKRIFSMFMHIHTCAHGHAGTQSMTRARAHIVVMAEVRARIRRIASAHPRMQRCPHGVRKCTHMSRAWSQGRVHTNTNEHYGLRVQHPHARKHNTLSPPVQRRYTS